MYSGNKKLFELLKEQIIRKLPRWDAEKMFMHQLTWAEIIERDKK